jgi:type VI secretion system secreted protein VgrG
MSRDDFRSNDPSGGGSRANAGPTGNGQDVDSALTRGADGLGSTLGSFAADDVAFDVDVQGVSARLGVRHFSVHEGLNRLGEVEVVALASANAVPAIADLLGKDCTVSWHRRSQARKFKGVIRTATTRDLVEGVELTLHVVPALWLLTRTLESRIYQDKSVPAIVETIVNELLGGRSRSMRSDVSRQYPVYEYVVQYQESYYSFISRLLEQEGIFFFFDHEDGDHERLVLADTSSNLPFVRSADQGRVPFARDPAQAPEHEAVSDVHHHREVGATDAVVGDFDWTNPGLTVRGEATGRGDTEPKLEIYDHTDAVQFHQYGGSSYGANTADRQVEMRAELLDLVRESWSMDATVVTVAPGRLIELSGSPDSDLDGKYLIIGADAYGTATEGREGTFHTRLRCVPQSMPYRPPRVTRRPIAIGFETATVVGPPGEEIHTDTHGRVKVQFHWDRRGHNDEHSSCWLRVMQTWAHGGFGAFFLPRIGMEVVVGFLGGNPDRPMVTGCVYNGRNTTPYSLPGEKTKSTLKTQSSPGGGGYNELRFEDKAGHEEIFIHAQKDLNEVVEHNHTTRVRANHVNTVGGNDTETVHRKQTLTVKKDREKTIEENEFRTIKMSRFSEITQNDTMTIKGSRTTMITADEELFVDMKRTTKVKDLELAEFQNSRKTVVTGDDKTHVTEEWNLEVGKAATIRHRGTLVEVRNQHFLVDAASSVRLTHSGSEVHIADGGSINVDATPGVTVVSRGSRIVVKDDKIGLSSPNEITLTVGSSVIKLTPAGVEISGASVKSSATGMNEISGAIVKIN